MMEGTKNKRGKEGKSKREEIKVLIFEGWEESLQEKGEKNEAQAQIISPSVNSIDLGTNCDHDEKPLDISVYIYGGLMLL